MALAMLALRASLRARCAAGVTSAMVGVRALLYALVIAEDHAPLLGAITFFWHWRP